MNSRRPFHFAGCFAAGTKLLTRNGWRTVETIRPGDEVLSRSEHDWSATAEWKRVEERFERTGCILHVHVGGEVIRTTPEHPFFVQGEGWKQAGALSGGDRIATLSGEWVGVEEVFDTQEWERVYNLRVADHHTYFVGDEHWGFAAWAHNRICGHHENTSAHNSSYTRTGTDQPSITDPANLILKAERIARGMTPACQGDSLTLAYLQIAGDSQPPIFASNSDSYTYAFPSVAAGQVTPGQGVNSEARKHAEVKAMIRAVQSGVSLTGKALTIFTDHDPCSYCDLSRGIENAARLFGAVSVTIWCPSGRIGAISL